MIARLRKSDRGLTMIELLVAVSIFAILLTMISALGTKIFRTTTGVVLSTTSENQYQNAMRRVTRQLRYAARLDGGTPAFDTVDSSQIIFYTYSLLQGGLTNLVPNKVRIWVDGTGQLNESVTTPTITAAGPTYTSTPIVSKLATNVTNTTAAPVFVFYDKADLASGQVIAVGTGMTLAQRQTIARALVTLQSTTKTVISVQQTVVFQNKL